MMGGSYWDPVFPVSFGRHIAFPSKVSHDVRAILKYSAERGKCARKRKAKVNNGENEKKYVDNTTGSRFFFIMNRVTKCFHLIHRIFSGDSGRGMICIS
jgi:hypothetical protein